MPDGDNPLALPGKVEVTQWHLLPAMHGTVLRQDSDDGPFRFMTPDQVVGSLLRPAFEEMGLKYTKKGTKLMALRQLCIKLLTEQHSGKIAW